MTDRRAFLAGTAAALGGLSLPLGLLAQALPRVDAGLHQRGDSPPDRLATDEAFWSEVRTGFDLDPAIVNLDNGWTNPANRAAVERLVAGARTLETLPAMHLPGIWETTTNTSEHCRARPLRVRIG